MTPTKYINAVEHMIEQFYELCERRYYGDTDAIVNVVDLLAAIKEANLTDKQTVALWLTAVGFSQEDSGYILGISRLAFHHRYHSAVRRVAEVYEEIERKDSL